MRVAYDPLLSWIEITAPNGLVYRFGNGEREGNPRGESAVGVLLGGGSTLSNENPTRTTSWGLTSVRNAVGRELLQVEYESDFYTSEQQIHYTQTKSVTKCGFGNSTNGPVCGSYVTPERYEGFDLDEGTGSYYQRVANLNWLPTRMVNPATGRAITFEYAADRTDLAQYITSSELPKRLTSVSLFDGDQTRTKVLEHTYATTDKNSELFYNRKLILEDVTEFDNEDVQRNLAKFKYNFEARSDGTYRTPSRLTPFVDAWGYLNSLSQAAQSFCLRGNNDYHYVFDIQLDRAIVNGANTFGGYSVRAGQQGGLSKNASLDGSLHGVLKEYSDGMGARITYAHGLHETATFAPPPQLEELTDYIGGVYACGNTTLNGCSTCKCDNPEDPRCGVEPDASNNTQTFQLRSGRDYAIKYSISRFGSGTDNREIRGRNVGCDIIENRYDCDNNPGFPDGNNPNCPLPQISGNLTVQLLSGGEILESENYSVNDALPDPNDDDDDDDDDEGLSETLTLEEIFDTASIARATSVKIQSFANHGTVYGELWGFELRDNGTYASTLVGGLRLERVVVEDLIGGKSSATAYTYSESTAEDAESSGLLLRHPLYGTRIELFAGSNGIPSDGSCQYERYSVAPDNPLLNSQGSHVEYTAVVERQENVDRGYTKRTYHRPVILVPGEVPEVGYNFFLEGFGQMYVPEDGNLLEEALYNSADKLVERHVYAYRSRTNPAEGSESASRIVAGKLNAECGGIAPDLGKCEAWLGDEILLIGRAASVYDWVNPVTSVTSYRDGVTWTTERSYTNVTDPYHLLTAVTTGQDGGPTRATEYEHAVYSSASDVRALARANHQVALVARETERYGSGGATNLRQVSASVSVLRPFTATGELSAAFTPGATVLRPYRSLRYGSDPETSILTATYNAYTPFGAPSSVTRYDDPAPVAIAYDADRPTEISYLNYLKTATYHGTSARAETVTDERAQLTQYAHDAMGRLETVTERDGDRVTSYGYGGYSQAASATGGKRNWTERTVAVTPTERSAITELKTRTYYDGWRLPIQTIHVDQLDGGGDRVEDLAYDAHGRPTERFDPFARRPSSTAVAPRPAGLLFRERYVYGADPLDRLRYTERPFFGTVYRGYGGGGGGGKYFRTVTADHEGHTTWVDTDVFGRERARGSRETDGYLVDNSYDGLGRLTGVRRAGPGDASAAQTIAYGYDDFGRLTAKTVPEEGLTAYRYDARDRLTVEQTPRSRALGFARGHRYDPYGDLVATGQLAAVPADGGDLPAFARTESTNLFGRTARAADFGRVTERSDAYATGGGAYAVSHEYDPYGRLEATATADGGRAVATARIAYDHLDHVTSYRETVAPPGGAAAAVEHEGRYNRYGYRGADVYTVDGGGSTTITRAYDKDGLLARERLGDGAGAGGAPWQEVAYRYYLNDEPYVIGDSGPGDVRFPVELAGSAAGASEPLFHEAVFRDRAHDTLPARARRDGRVSWTSTRLGGGVPLDVGYAYDRTRDNVLASTSTAWRTGGTWGERAYVGLGAYATAYTYAPGRAGLRKLTRVERWRPGGPGLDAAGVRADAIALSYGDADRPARVTAVADLAGPGSAEGLYRAPAGPSVLGYDAAGALTAAPGVTFAYDGSGRPATVAVDGRATANSNLFNGERVGFRAAGGSEVRRYGGIELAGGRPDRYYFDNGYYDFAEARFVYCIKDHLGTPRVWFTDVNGDGVIKADDDVLETRTAYPFGMFAFGSKAEGYESDRRDFTGHELVGATNDQASRYQSVLDAGARTYLPGLGIFAQVDPLADQMPSYSPYGYGFNDPVSYIDPTGLSPETFGVGRSNGELGATSSDLTMTDPRGWEGACPPGADCPGSADNVGIIRDPSDSEAGSDFAMFLARGAFYFAEFTGVNALDNAAANYLDAETTAERVHSGIEVAGAAFSLNVRGGKAGAASNPVPTRLARVVPAEINSKTLGAPGAKDVFVTAASDIQGMNSSQIANALTIPANSGGFKVIEFSTPSFGVATPINRTNPGFTGGGRTAGGAREFVVPNQLIPAGSTVKTRY